MTLQFIQDTQGNTTGVFIPIEEWQTLKIKYSELQTEEESKHIELAKWQKQIIDERLLDYYNNPESAEDFDQMLDEIERTI